MRKTGVSLTLAVTFSAAFWLILGYLFWLALR
jgi:hypothetical protein